MDLKNKPYVMCKDYFKREYEKAKAAIKKVTAKKNKNEVTE